MGDIYEMSKISLSAVELPLRTGNNTVLQIGHHLQNSLSELASSLFLVNGYFVCIVFVHEGLNGAHDSCSARAESFINALLLAGSHELLDLEWTS